MKPHPLTPALSRLRERVRTGYDEVKTSSYRINKTLEMHGAALLSGKLTHVHAGEPILKLAMSDA